MTVQNSTFQVKTNVELNITIKNTFPISCYIIQAHKYLLSSKSFYFKRLFQTNQSVYTVIVEDYPSFINFIKWVYTDEIELDDLESSIALAMKLESTCYLHALQSEFYLDDSPTKIFVSDQSSFVANCSPMFTIEEEQLVSHTHEMIDPKNAPNSIQVIEENSNIQVIEEDGNQDLGAYFHTEHSLLNWDEELSFDPSFNGMESNSSTLPKRFEKKQLPPIPPPERTERSERTKGSINFHHTIPKRSTRFKSIKLYFNTLFKFNPHK